jgi:bifunctional non-homologous end joining protein LigD
MPGFIDPCDPTLHERAPIGSEWVYEIKTDGYRAQVHIRDGKVTVFSRSGYNWTQQFGAIAKAAAKLKVRDAIIDGEATVLGDTGIPDFQALRRELGNPASPGCSTTRSTCFISTVRISVPCRCWIANER